MQQLAVVMAPCTSIGDDDIIDIYSVCHFPGGAHHCGERREDSHLVGAGT